MKALLIVGEWLVGLVMLLLSLITISLGLIVSVIEIPRYLRIKSM
jgi:hypothetical protein